MSDFESRPPATSTLGCLFWFGSVVAYPLATLVLFSNISVNGPLMLLAIPVGLFLLLIASTVFARALQQDPEASSPVGMALGLFLGGLFLSAAVYFFGCSMAFKGL